MREDANLKRKKRGGREPKLPKWEKIAEKEIEEGMDLKEVVVYVKNEVEYSNERK